jgi:hypothetical protein
MDLIMATAMPPHLQTAARQPGLSSAEAKFESAQKASRKLREAETKAVDEKTKRLRALRLAKEAADSAPAEIHADDQAK